MASVFVVRYDESGWNDSDRTCRTIHREVSVGKRSTEMQGIRIQRPKRTKLSAKESLKRVQEFTKRKEEFIAAIREGKS